VHKHLGDPFSAFHARWFVDSWVGEAGAAFATRWPLS